MSTQLSFDVTFVYPDRTDGITIPTVLSFGDKVVNTSAKVDPGSEYCVFSREIGEKPGLDIERGISQPMGSLTGILDTFGHEVTIQTFDIAFQTIIYFAKFMPSAGLCRVAFQPIRHPLILPTTSSRNQFEKIGII